MSQMLYDLINSPTSWFIVGAWLLLCIVSEKKRESLLIRLWNLVAKPIIFEQDPKPESYRFYARKSMETIAKAFKDVLVQPFKDIIAWFRLWIKSQIDKVHRPDRHFRVIGYVIYLVFFVLFVWADAIAIVNTLATLHLLSGDVPEFLTRFELAVAMGSLGAVIVAGLVTMDVYGKQSVISNWEDQEGYWKELAKGITRIMFLLAFIVVFFFGVQRLSVLQPLYTSTDTVKFWVDAVVVIAVPLNTVLTTALIGFEAILGTLVVLILAQVIILGMIYVLNYLATLLAYVLPFILDVVYRIVLIVLDILFYIILAPIELVITIISAPFGIGKPKPVDTSNPGPKQEMTPKVQSGETVRTENSGVSLESESAG